MNFYDPSFPAVEALSMSTTPPPVNQFKVTRSPSTSSSSSSSTSTSSVKSRVGTQSQRTAAAQRRIRAAPYTCPRESCGASFTSLHNMRCEIIYSNTQHTCLTLVTQLTRRLIPINAISRAGLAIGCSLDFPTYAGITATRVHHDIATGLRSRGRLSYSNPSL
jgi:hypothetical protein